MSQESDLLSIVQAILQEDRNLELRPGDIGLLVLIHDSLDARADHWRSEVLVPMQVVLRDLLVSVQRHQRQLDRQHEALRDFIPMLLKQHSEHSIERCDTQLREVLETIGDRY